MCAYRSLSGELYNLKNTRENNKILSVTYPDITSYTWYAYPLTILSYNENSLSWFYNYLFQLCITLDEANVRHLALEKHLSKHALY